MSAEAKARLKAFWAGGRLQLLCIAVVEKFLPLNVRSLCGLLMPTHRHLHSVMGKLLHAWHTACPNSNCLGSERNVLLVLQAKELQEWAESPAAFHHEADMGSWQDHLRGCAEVLLASLLEVSFYSHAQPLNFPHN